MEDWAALAALIGLVILLAFFASAPRAQGKPGESFAENLTIPARPQHKKMVETPLTKGGSLALSSGGRPQYGLSNAEITECVMHSSDYRPPCVHPEA